MSLVELRERMKRCSWPALNPAAQADRENVGMSFGKEGQVGLENWR